MRAVTIGIALAATLLVGACGDDGVEIVASGDLSQVLDDNTFTVLDVAADDGVTYTVRTPDELVREIRYDAIGPIGVFDTDGVLVAGAGTIAARVEDARLALLDLPSDPQVGYAALGIDFPLPSATEAPDAVLPDGVEEAYEVACSRQSQTWTESDGCTYGLFIDTCDNGTFWGSYQKKSGCAFFGWFCDCPGGSDGGQM